MVPLQGLRRDGTGGHGRIGFVAHVVVAGDVENLRFQMRHLLPRLVDRLLVAPGLGVFLDQVAHVHDEVRAQRRRELERRVRSGGLLAAGFEFQRAAARIEHVVGIRQNHEFEFGGRHHGTIEHHREIGKMVL